MASQIRATVQSFAAVASSTSETAVLSCVIPAGSLQVGETYRFRAIARYNRGATATASSMRCRVLLNGAGALPGVTAATQTTNGTSGNVTLDGTFTIQSLGAAGAYALEVQTVDNIASGTVVRSLNPPITNQTVNTAADITLSISVSFNVAVTALTFTRLGGYIERLD